MATLDRNSYSLIDLVYFSYYSSLLIICRCCR